MVLKNHPYNITAFSGLDNAVTEIFYMSMKYCPSTTYPFFNSTNNMCQDLCADYYFSNFTDKKCYKCHYTCLDCNFSTLQTMNTCSKCNVVSDFRLLSNNSCICANDKFDDGYSSKCRNCSSLDINVLTCIFALNTSLNSNDYLLMFMSSLYPSNIMKYYNSTTCKANYFIDSTSNLCQKCIINNCGTCLNSTYCESCITPFVKSPTGQCYLCSITNCVSCSSDNLCA
jgi:hypothetical protein